MEYQNIIDYLKQKNKHRIAMFIQMYYVEQKSQKEIMTELYIDTVWWYYSFRRRVKTIIQTLIDDNKKLANMQ